MNTVPIVHEKSCMLLIKVAKLGFIQILKFCLNTRSHTAEQECILVF